MNPTAKCLKKCLSTYFLLFISIQLNFAQITSTSFNKLCQLIESKDFFSARDLFMLNRTDFNAKEQVFILAILDNAFNKPIDSNKKIALLNKSSEVLPDTLRLKIQRIQEDNFVKLKDYAGAKRKTQKILQEFDPLLSTEVRNDLRNNLKIWSALAHIGPQRIEINGDTRLKMTKDRAGLKNLKLTINGDTASFIFDTGANLSTVSESVAKRLHMDIIREAIDVDAITGISIKADLAVCKQLKLGQIIISDVIFLVFPDSALYIPQINYQINGILGFPVIEALQEVQLTQDDFFIVPKTLTVPKKTSNLAIDGLTPLIAIDGKHYTFDTGAEKTILYAPFYETCKQEIEKNNTPTKIVMGGAGGKVDYDGFVIEHTFHIGDKPIVIKNISLLKSKIKNETVYGNIGQDIIRKFYKMTLNFKDMFIHFE
ncbi:retropepsin-like aspartic protease [Sphingobacterium sp.]|uniref:retropepsin-like aspartic protease n=1 Tax=Sphingobacterium sp. TaxID=341027 RepID=UPI002FDCD9BE